MPLKQRILSLILVCIICIIQMSVFIYASVDSNVVKFVSGMVATELQVSEGRRLQAISGVSGEALTNITMSNIKIDSNALTASVRNTFNYLSPVMQSNWKALYAQYGGQNVQLNNIVLKEMCFDLFVTNARNSSNVISFIDSGNPSFGGGSSRGGGASREFNTNGGTGTGGTSGNDGVNNFISVGSKFETEYITQRQMHNYFTALRFEDSEYNQIYLGSSARTTILNTFSETGYKYVYEVEFKTANAERNVINIPHSGYYSYSHNHTVYGVNDKGIGYRYYMSNKPVPFVIAPPSGFSSASFPNGSMDLYIDVSNDVFNESDYNDLRVVGFFCPYPSTSSEYLDFLFLESKHNVSLRDFSYFGLNLRKPYISTMGFYFGYVDDFISVKEFVVELEEEKEINDVIYSPEYHETINDNDYYVEYYIHEADEYTTVHNYDEYNPSFNEENYDYSTYNEFYQEYITNLTQQNNYVSSETTVIINNVTQINNYYPDESVTEVPPTEVPPTDMPEPLPTPDVFDFPTFEDLDITGDRIQFDKLSDSNITKKFPFSIPFDIWNILRQFVSESEPMEIILPFGFKDDNGDSYILGGEDIVLDLSQFDGIIKLFRSLELVAFVLSLMSIHNKLNGE